MAVVAVYYWTAFSARIDNLLRGEIYTRSAGIYAAPKQLRVGEALSRDELLAYLKRAGYVEKTQQADMNRGRYSLSGGTIEIEPSQDSSVDASDSFRMSECSFRDAKTITALTNWEETPAGEDVA